MINIINLSMRFGGKILFQNVNLQFNPGCHYGLIGANGSGKSTLIKILAGEMTPEKGDFTVPTQFTIGTLKQDQYLYENEIILDVVLRGRPKLWEALEKKKSLLQQDQFTEENCHCLDELENVIAGQDGYTAPSEAAKLLEGLGIRNSFHDQPLKILSGGYKLRVLLAKLLFGRPEILILDEPTNHLDLFSIKWLEGYLKQFEGTLIVSSHDRHFLNTVCTHIADVDCGSIKIYKGNYDEFVEQKKFSQEQKEGFLEKQEKKKAHLQEFIDRFGAKASKAKQAQSKARIVEKLEDEIDSIDFTPSSRMYPKLQFSPYRSSGASPLKIQGISKSFGSKIVLKGVSFEVERGDRVAILGPNGIGKSTLLEILTSRIKADEGSYEWGFATRVGYFPQDHSKEVNGKVSILEWLSQVDSTIPQEKLRGILGLVLFSGDAVKQQVNTLSGGETARLVLAKMMLQQPNILIFDEPTNHLDIEAIDALSEALENFSETLIVVSHNRYFVSRIASRIIEITEHGVKDFKCSYDEYVAKQEQDLLSVSGSLKRRYEKQEQIQSTSYEDQKKLRNMLGNLKKKVERAEIECNKIEAKINELDQILISNAIYDERQQKLLDERKELEDLLTKSYENWEMLSLELQEAECKIN